MKRGISQTAVTITFGKSTNRNILRLEPFVQVECMSWPGFNTRPANI